MDVPFHVPFSCFFCKRATTAPMHRSLDLHKAKRFLFAMHFSFRAPAPLPPFFSLRPGYKQKSRPTKALIPGFQEPFCRLGKNMKGRTPPYLLLHRRNGHGHILAQFAIIGFLRAWLRDHIKEKGAQSLLKNR